jgi:hypothetical protein
MTHRNELTTNQLKALEVSIGATIRECATIGAWPTVDKLRDRKYQIQQELTLRALTADDTHGTDSTGQRFEYDTQPLPLLNPGLV